MNIHCFHLNNDRELTPSETTGVPDDWATSPHPHWVDIQADDMESGAIPELVRSLNLHPLILEGCRDLERAPRFAAFPNAMFFSVPTREHWEELRSRYIGFIVLRNFLLTIHQLPIPSFNQIVHEMPRTNNMIGNNTESVLYHVLDYVIDSDVLLGLQARDHLEILTKKFDEDPNDVTIRDIRDLRRKVGNLSAMFENQLYSVVSLQTHEASHFNISGLREYYRDLASHLEYAIRAVIRVDRRIKDIHDDYVLNLQNKTNSRLRTLTILSAMFSPLMVITGIYGMNFTHMPEIDKPWAYPAVLLLMVLVASGSMTFFWFRGWFED